jgi:hypothetical protein
VEWQPSLQEGNLRAASITARDDCEFLTIGRGDYNGILRDVNESQITEKVTYMKELALFKNVSYATVGLYSCCMQFSHRWKALGFNPCEPMKWKTGFKGCLQMGKLVPLRHGAERGVRALRARLPAKRRHRAAGRVGTFHNVILQSKHHLMTAGMVHVTNLTPREWQP